MKELVCGEYYGGTWTAVISSRIKLSEN